MTHQLTLPTTEYTHRFVCYAAAHGRGPKEQIAADRRRYPGGCMTGYQIWMGRKLTEWKSARGMDRWDRMDEGEQMEFDLWISAESER